MLHFIRTLALDAQIQELPFPIVRFDFADSARQRSQTSVCELQVSRILLQYLFVTRTWGTRSMFSYHYDLTRNLGDTVDRLNRNLPDGSAASSCTTSLSILVVSPK